MASLAISGALAQLTPASAQDALHPEVLAFVSSDGFSPTETPHSVTGLLASRDGAPAHDVSAMEMALLLLDAREAPLPRVRYHLVVSHRQIGTDVFAFVDVQRYNLGPAVRSENVSSYGEENVADPSVFGVGPNVAWRIVTRRTGVAEVGFIVAGRKRIPDDQANAASCSSMPCLGLASSNERLTWSGAPLPKAIDHTPAYARTFAYRDGNEIVEEPRPAYQALQLAIAAGIATAKDGRIVWRTSGASNPDKPHHVVVIDRNLGQDILADAALGLFETDAQPQRWFRLGSVAADGKLHHSFWTSNGESAPAPTAD